MHSAMLISVKVRTDEVTYFQPACELGNDKSGMQKENEGCEKGVKSSPGYIYFAKTHLSQKPENEWWGFAQLTIEAKILDAVIQRFVGQLG